MENPQKNEIQGKIDFIEQHEEEIIPILNEHESEVLRHIEEEKSGASLAEINEIIKKFETKVFLMEKQEDAYNPDAKRILITASETLAGNLMKPIIDELKKDKRCRAICFLADSFASLREMNDPDFKKIDKKNTPVLYDALSTAEKEPYDIVLTACDSVNSPSSVALFGGKSNFGADRTFILVGGWLGVGSDQRLQNEERIKNIERIDGVFCNDRLARKIIAEQMDWFPKEKIYDIGTPMTDGLETESADYYRQEGRKKLAIKEEEYTVLYLGDVSTDLYTKLYGCDSDVNEKTYDRVVNALKGLAKIKPDKKICLAIRPHPADPKKELLLSQVGQVGENIRGVAAPKEKITMPEAVYASDLVLSIAGNEAFLAGLRGKKAIFLGFDKNLGENILNGIFSEDTQSLIKQDERYAIIKNEDELKEEIEKAITAKDSLKPENKEKSIEKILDIIFEN